ncbi:hypothetical protein L21TH_0970 [Caldisalinibacter kiritimatiensis]|uniref:Uncharacterized protein n=1 Tax=Caldisalinibacter kiritimatiensis TaxID=1304284 RepID=R1CQM9_9FIRM|nr:hypothetical protein L21TH_0970 [Caldisalinibacter kiritimatiensis]
MIGSLVSEPSIANLYLSVKNSVSEIINEYSTKSYNNVT